jgi:hypothetical protein
MFRQPFAHRTPKLKVLQHGADAGLTPIRKVIKKISLEIAAVRLL